MASNGQEVSFMGYIGHLLGNLEGPKQGMFGWEDYKKSNRNLVSCCSSNESLDRPFSMLKSTGMMLVNGVNTMLKVASDLLSQNPVED